MFPLLPTPGLCGPYPAITGYQPNDAADSRDAREHASKSAPNGEVLHDQNDQKADTTKRVLAAGPNIGKRAQADDPQSRRRHIRDSRSIDKTGLQR